MTDRFHPPPNLVRTYPPLPAWLERRLLGPDEQVNWVRGPRLSPWWERYATHPLQFLAAVAVGAACVGAGRLIAGSWDQFPAVLGVMAGVIVLASLFVLGLAAGYFTRLVVTDARVIIVQGCEVCRSWALEDLPHSLVRFSKVQGEESRTVDLDAVQTLFGATSDQFTEAKTILSFGKQLDRIKAREKGCRHPDRTEQDG